MSGIGFIPEKEKRRLLKTIANTVQRKAVRMCPIDLGELRASIHYEIEGDVIWMIADTDYAEDMEYGKPPEPLSKNEKDDVKQWAKRHGLKSGKGIIWSLEHKGIKVGNEKNPLHITSYGRDSYRPFMRPAIHQSRDEMQAAIDREIR